jgi:hypothetical protein
LQSAIRPIFVILDAYELIAAFYPLHDHLGGIEIHSFPDGTLTLDLSLTIDHLAGTRMDLISRTPILENFKNFNIFCECLLKDEIVRRRKRG